MNILGARLTTKKESKQKRKPANPSRSREHKPPSSPAAETSLMHRPQLKRIGWFGSRLQARLYSAGIKRTAAQSHLVPVCTFE